MLITAVEPRRKSLVEVFLDGQSAGQVDWETAERLHVKPGRTMSDEEWAVLCKESDVTRARSYALWILSRRSISSKKLLEKIKEQYNMDAANAAVERMQELGLVNDTDYARRCASDLFRLRHFSVARVVQELRQRGIDSSLARQVAEEVAEEMAPDPQEVLRSLLETKFSGRLETEKDRRRTIAALQRMGYRWEDIRTAIGALDEEYTEM